MIKISWKRDKKGQKGTKRDKKYKKIWEIMKTFMSLFVPFCPFSQKFLKGTENIFGFLQFYASEILTQF